MDQEKVGKLLKKLREERNISQEELSNIINVSRQTLSKWELGKSPIDSTILIKICQIFEISIDDLLNCRINHSKKYDKTKKVVIKIIIILLMLLLVYFIYYFINQYNSTYVYSIKSENSELIIKDGILVSSNNNLYFSLGTINNNFDYDYMKLYYIKEGDEIFVVESTNNFISFNSFYGCNEYLDIKNIEYFINDLYVELCDEKICKNFKLILDKKYKNDNIFFKKNNCVLENIENRKKINNNEILEYIKNNFVKKDDGLIKEVINNSKRFELIFINDSNTLIVDSYENDIILEEWNYNFNLNILYYYNYKERFKSKYLSSDNVECVQGNCNSKNVYNELFDIIKK